MNDRLENLAASLGFPRELVSGAAVLTSFGDSCLFIENHKGIIEYGREQIKLQARPCKLQIIGTNLDIAFYTAEEIKITGKVSEIRYYR
ncbi:MAG: sporulation protein [Lachnospiraceae bacterium]|jgi:sporulation protein YqfC|nr:sporulation protein [Lachnospiraceae bacterium]